MKRLLTILLTAVLICASFMRVNIVSAEEKVNEDSMTTTESVEDTNCSTTETAGKNLESLIPTKETMQETVEELFTVVSEDDAGLSTEETVSESDDLQTESEAYAILADNGSLVFFRSASSYTNGSTYSIMIDGKTYTGIVFGNIESLSADSQDSIPWYENRESIKKVFVASEQTVSPISTAYWFRGCSNLESFDAAGFDTSNVLDMTFMFSACKWNEETKMYSSSLRFLDLRSFDTSKVEYMNDMFFGCTSLTDLKINNFNTSSVKEMRHMFESCSSLPSLDIHSFDTSNVEEMRDMFSDCPCLQSLDLSGFDTSNAIYMSGMFQGCASLISLDLSNMDTSNVRGMDGMFAGCTSLKILDLSGFDTSNVMYMGNMFSGCSSLVSLDISSFKTSKVKTMGSMFNDCASLSSIDLSNFDTSSATAMNGMFSHCTSLSSLDLRSFNTSNVKNMSSLFYGCSSLSSLDLSNFNTQNVTHISNMFSECSSLKILDLSSFDTSNVTNMEDVFSGCSSLESLDLSGFHTENVTSMKNMFSGCSSLATLDLSDFSTASVWDMDCMFSGCSSLKSLDLSGFLTWKAANMRNMFSDCSSLKTLDLSSFGTGYVMIMSGMFSGCSSLEYLDISSFNTKNARFMDDMFKNCSNLASVKLGPEFINWFDDAYLPNGNWVNNQKRISKTEKELYDQYPSHNYRWTGTWIKNTKTNQEYFRIYDESRIQESIKTANELKKVLGIDQFQSIIIAKDSDFADALSGSYLATRKSAPILLVNNYNHEQAYEYIQENLKDNGIVYILGSFSAVSSDFEEGLDPSVNVKRLEGSSRYITNLEILKEAGMAPTKELFIVTGSGYADSLSAGSIGIPIMMLDNTSEELKNSQRDFIIQNVRGNIYILGDENAVNNSLEKQLKHYHNSGDVIRIGGSSRWETTRLIAQYFFDSPANVVLATGNDFADGLIASPLAYATYSPLLMVASNKTYQAKTYVGNEDISKAYIIGSKDFVSDDAARKILLLGNGVTIVEK